MAILANLEYRGIKLKNAYVQIREIWGSSKGWNALVGVAVSKDAASKKAFLYQFNVGEVTGSEDVYERLYEVVKQKLTKQNIEFCDDQVPDSKLIQPVIEPVTEDAIEPVTEDAPVTEDVIEPVTEDDPVIDELSPVIDELSPVIDETSAPKRKKKVTK
jgi:hypothetical protein